LDVWTLSGAPRVELKGSELYGALAIQLLMAVSRSSGVETCDGCGKFYTPTRQPREGDHHFCDECGRKAATRLAQQRRRAGLAKPRRKKGESDKSFLAREKEYERRIGTASIGLARSDVPQLPPQPWR
jgi:hypothetical protein